MNNNCNINWNELWRLKIHDWYEIFLWRCANNGLPWHSQVDQPCPLDMLALVVKSTYLVIASIIVLFGDNRNGQFGIRVALVRNKVILHLFLKKIYPPADFV